MRLSVPVPRAAAVLLCVGPGVRGPGAAVQQWRHRHAQHRPQQRCCRCGRPGRSAGDPQDAASGAHRPAHHIMGLTPWNRTVQPPCDNGAVPAAPALAHRAPGLLCSSTCTVGAEQGALHACRRTSACRMRSWVLCQPCTWSASWWRASSSTSSPTTSIPFALLVRTVTPSVSCCPITPQPRALLCAPLASLSNAAMDQACAKKTPQVLCSCSRKELLLQALGLPCGRLGLCSRVSPSTTAGSSLPASSQEQVWLLP